MAGRLRVLKARAGRMVRGRFVAVPARKNIAQGFRDSRGVFHPIRASADYDPLATPRKKPKRRTKKPKAAAKPKPRKKTKRPFKTAKAKKRATRKGRR